jgi:hypothetical protein
MTKMKQYFAKRQVMEKKPMRQSRQRQKLLSIALPLLCLATLGFGGCGQTATPPTPASQNTVYSYFGSPFSIAASDLPKSVSTFDHSADQIGVSSFISTPTAQVPSAILNGTFTTAPTGFLKITETFATTGSGVISPQNPPLTGAWAVEIPGAGALANLLNVNNTGSGIPVLAAPAAMAENTACPIFSQTSAPFLYVTVPNAGLTTDTADYGGVNISTLGSAVTLAAQPFLIGPVEQAPSTVTGGCSNTFFGPLTAYPLNSFGTASNVELIATGESGLLVSSFTSGNSGSSPGAFGGGTGVIGVAEPTGQVDLGSVVGAQYNGFIYAPQTAASSNYDVSVLASAFGDNTATSQACSTLQSSLAANKGQGAGTVAALPSANSIYGGEFLTTTSAGSFNDPTGSSGSENCDVAIDLGNQDSLTNGLFPHATVFIGSNYPPFGANKPWVCFGTKLTCAVSFPAAAVVGKVQGQYVIFVVASAFSNPAAQLPNNLGDPIAQPVGIYLFQKMQ